MLSFIIAEGGDIEAKDNQGKTSLHLGINNKGTV
jgi:hypothetical protein